MKRMTGLLSLAMVVAVLMSGCGTQNSPEPFGGGGKSGGSGMTKEQAMAGASDEIQTIYTKNCLSCHGGSLEGKIGPNTNLQKVGSRMNKEQIAKQINQGGNGMPGFGGKLKPEEAEALAAWLAEKK